MKKTNKDIWRLLFVHTVGEDKADIMLADVRKRFFGGAVNCQLDEEVSDEFYQEAVVNIPREMPHFLEFLCASNPQPERH